jgi:hypothetical protein
MTGFESPNYTQIPNDLFDLHMAHMGMAELKVLLGIMRWTFGFHLTERRLSLTKLQAITGLSRSSVMDGIIEAVDHGFIERDTRTGVTLFRINVMHPIKYQKKDAGSAGLPLLEMQKSATSRTPGGSAVQPVVAPGVQTGSPELPPSNKETSKESNSREKKTYPPGFFKKSEKNNGSNWKFNRNRFAHTEPLIISEEEKARLREIFGTYKDEIKEN